MPASDHSAPCLPATRAPRGAVAAVDLLLDTIRRSIDAAKPVALTAVSEKDVCALLVMDSGATFERRWMMGSWVWVEGPAVPTSRLSTLRLLEEHGMADGDGADGTVAALSARATFNQTMYFAVRHLLQAFAKEDGARNTVAEIREKTLDFPRPMGVPHPSADAEAALRNATAVTDSAIVELVDQMYDLADGTRVPTAAA
jgi:hypothetical protein